MVNTLETISRGMAAGERLALKLLMLLLTVAVLIQITARNVGHFVSWSEDVALLLFTWIVFLGGSLAVREGTHYVIDVFSERFVRLRAVLGLVSVVGMASFLGLLVWQGCLMTYKVSGRISGAGGLDMALYFIVLPLAAVCALFHLVEVTMGYLRTLKGIKATQ